MYIEGGRGSAGYDYATCYDAPFIQAMFPLDPVLGNNPRDPAVMVHNVARYHFAVVDCVLNLNFAAKRKISFDIDNLYW